MAKFTIGEMVRIKDSPFDRSTGIIAEVNPPNLPEALKNQCSNWYGVCVSFSDREKDSAYTLEDDETPDFVDSLGDDVPDMIKDILKNPVTKLGPISEATVLFPESALEKAK